MKAGSSARWRFATFRKRRTRTRRCATTRRGRSATGARSELPPGQAAARTAKPSSRAWSRRSSRASGPSSARNARNARSAERCLNALQGGVHDRLIVGAHLPTQQRRRLAIKTQTRADARRGRGRRNPQRLAQRPAPRAVHADGRFATCWVWVFSVSTGKPSPKVVAFSRPKIMVCNQNSPISSSSCSSAASSLPTSSA